MFVGDVNARTLSDASRYRQLTYTCLDTFVTRQPETIAFPNRKCKEGIMTSLRFPTCWDGKNLDSREATSSYVLLCSSLLKVYTANIVQRIIHLICRIQRLEPSSPLDLVLRATPFEWGNSCTK